MTRYFEYRLVFTYVWRLVILWTSKVLFQMELHSGITTILNLMENSESQKNKHIALINMLIGAYAFAQLSASWHFTRKFWAIIVYLHMKVLPIAFILHEIHGNLTLQEKRLMNVYNSEQ